LNVHDVNRVRQTEIHTVQPSVPETNFEVETDVASLKRYKLPVTVKFQREWSKQEVVRCVLRSSCLLILFGMRKNYHGTGRLYYCTFL